MKICNEKDASTFWSFLNKAISVAPESSTNEINRWFDNTIERLENNKSQFTESSYQQILSELNRVKRRKTFKSNNKAA